MAGRLTPARRSTVLREYQIVPTTRITSPYLSSHVGRALALRRVVRVANGPMRHSTSASPAFGMCRSGFTPRSQDKFIPLDFRYLIN